MKFNQFKVKTKVWLYPGMAHASVKASATQGAWHFITIPKKQSQQIKARFGMLKRGWGSLPISATILRNRSGQVGKTTWNTSIFPDKKADAYLLPLKADVRKKEGIAKGDTITLLLEIKT